MAKYCTKCGAALAANSLFCGKCGTKVNNDGNVSDISENQVENQNNRKSSKLATIFWSVVLIVVVVSWFVQRFGSQINTSWAVNEACAEVKSVVYRDYGEIPEVKGELIYKEKEDAHYIVVVRYEIPSWDWEASCACLVYGYRESNCYVSNMTTEMSYDYDYEASLGELKALWALK